MNAAWGRIYDKKVKTSSGTGWSCCAFLPVPITPTVHWSLAWHLIFNAKSFAFASIICGSASARSYLTSLSNPSSVFFTGFDDGRVWETAFADLMMMTISCSNLQLNNTEIAMKEFAEYGSVNATFVL